MTPQLGISLALHVAGGAAIGAVYFVSLWWNTQLFERAGRWRTLIASMALRFILLAGALTAASLEGAMPLLAAALGVLLARALVLRRIRLATP